MVEDKAHFIRRALSVVCVILFFSTVGLFMISMQLKTITLDYYGTKKQVKTLSTNVQDFLIQNNVVVSANDTIWPEKNSKLEDGMVIEIKSDSKLATIDVEKLEEDSVPMVAQIEEVIESIPFEEETTQNSSIERGVQNVVKEGTDGQVCTKYLVVYENNQVVERAKIATDIITEAQNKVIEVGTKINTVSRSNIVQSLASVVPTEADGFRYYNINLSRQLQEYAFNISKKYGIDYELFLAVMYKESGFNPNASSGSAFGLCQIHYSNFNNLSNKLGITNFYDPYDNMTAGAYMLAHYMAAASQKVSGNDITVYALNSYNMGEAAYYSSCYSRGILDRAYSNGVLTVRNNLLTTGHC